MDCGRALASTAIGPTLVRFETFGGASADWHAESVHPRAAEFAVERRDGTTEDLAGL